MKIYLARHGQNLDNKMGILNGHRDLSLTQLGIEQAEGLADHIKNLGINFDAVLSSPLSRAKHTAEIIVKKIGHKDVVLEEPLLIERNFGIMTGVEQNKIESLCYLNIIKTDNIIYFLDVEGAETFPDLMDRAGIFLNNLKIEYSELSNILLVCHGDIGKMIYAKFYNLDWKNVLINFHFGNSEMLLLQNGILESEHFVFKQEQKNH